MLLLLCFGSALWIPGNMTRVRSPSARLWDGTFDPGDSGVYTVSCLEAKLYAFWKNKNGLRTLKYEDFL